jgi:hypothetical protein
MTFSELPLGSDFGVVFEGNLFRLRHRLRAAFGTRGGFVARVCDAT